jgi:hypothetical protein
MFDVVSRSEGRQGRPEQVSQGWAGQGLGWTGLGWAELADHQSL